MKYIGYQIKTTKKYMLRSSKKNKTLIFALFSCMAMAPTDYNVQVCFDLSTPITPYALLIFQAVEKAKEI